MRGSRGFAPQVKRNAQQRLEEAADRMARQLLGIAETAESEAVERAAVRDALDRVIGCAPTTLDVSVGPRSWETVFDTFASGSRGAP